MSREFFAKIAPNFPAPTSKGALGFFFVALSKLYEAAVRLRLFLYSAKLLPTHKIDGVRVISVGNITAGGTGKTPTVVMLARMLDGSVAVVSRGFGRKSREPVQLVSDGKEVLAKFPDAADEPLMCAEELKTVPVICAPRRIKGIDVAYLTFGARTILLDDAFSHLAAGRDKNLLLVDATNPFGGGRMLPAGFLREPLSSIKRADAVVITRANMVADETLGDLRKKISELARPGTPLFACDIRPTSVISPDLSEKPAQTLSGRKVVLFSAIGSPGQFEGVVRSLGAVVTGHFSFRDHHPFSQGEIDTAVGSLEKGAVLLTTQKDMVRIPRPMRGFFHVLKVEASVRENDGILRFLRS